jgi:hypothetical protein
LLAASCGGRVGIEPQQGSGGADGSSPGETGGAAGSGAATGATGSGGVAGTTTPGPAADAAPRDETDPNYPYVEWLNGRGYEKFCPRFAGGWGMQCWSFDGRRSELCQDPANCNACTCFVPCGQNSLDAGACLPGATGRAVPECVADSPNSVGSCMLTCDRSGPCPNGMTCADYPDLPRKVCVWLRR